MGYWKNIFTDQMILDSGIDEETITHKCPCGKGEIVEYHDNYKQLYLLPLQEKARKWINAEKAELNKLKSNL